MRVHFGLLAETRSGAPNTFSDRKLERFAARLLHAQAGHWSPAEVHRLVEAERRKLAQAGHNTRIISYNGLLKRFGGTEATKQAARRVAGEMGLALDGSALAWLWEPADAERQANRIRQAEL